LADLIASSITIAKGRLAKIEMERFGDIDIHEGEYESEYDSGSEGTQSEAGSVFHAAWARMRDWEEPGGPVQEAPREGPRQGGWKGYLVFVCLIFLLAGYYFFNKI